MAIMMAPLVQATMGLDGLPLCVKPEDLGVSRVSANEPQQETDGRRLACTVGPEVSQYLTSRHLKIEILESVDLAVALRQSLCANRRRFHQLGVLFVWAVQP
jgi:hypothetical protein